MRYIGECHRSVSSARHRGVGCVRFRVIRRIPYPKDRAREGILALSHLGEHDGAVRGPETAAIAKTTATTHRQNDSLLLVFMVIPFCWHRIFCMEQPLRRAPCMSHQCFPWHALNKTRTVLTMKCMPRPRQRQLRALSISETTRYREFGHRLENRASAKKGISPKTKGPPLNPLAQN